MPTYNMVPILHPQKKDSDIFNMLTDFLDIREKEIALSEGGDIYNPSSYDELINQYRDMSNDMSLTDDQRRTAEKKMRGLEVDQLKTGLDQKKELNSASIEQMMEQDLRELEFTVPNDPIAYSEGALMKYQDMIYGTSEKEGLLDTINTLASNHINTTQLESLLDEYQGQASKYSDLLNAYDNRDMTRLGEYAVVYTPHAGKVKSMKIISRSEAAPEYTQPTNMAFNFDDKGGLRTSASDAGGIPIYFVRSNPGYNEKYNFGNSQFTYDNDQWESDNVEGFDFTTIKHAPLHSIPPGNFVKSSDNKLYFVNRDKTFSPVKDQWKQELGYSEEKVYNLSPNDEINTLRGAVDILMSPVMERYRSEAQDYSQSGAGGFGDFTSAMATGGLAKKIPEFAGGIEAGIRKGIGGFIDVTKQAFKKAWTEPKEKKTGPYKPNFPTTEGAQKTSLTEEAGKFIQSLNIFK